MIKVIWLQQENYEIVDGQKYIIRLPKLLSTFKLGKYFRDEVLNLSYRDKSSTHRYEILIPNDCEVSVDFVRGLFGESVVYFSDTSNNKEVGLENFLTKYSLRYEFDAGSQDPNTQLLFKEDILKTLKTLL